MILEFSSDLVITDKTFIKDAPAFPTNVSAIIADPHHPSYDVDTLIDSLDYESLYLNDNDQSAPISANQKNFICARRDKALANRYQYSIPEKPSVSSNEEDDQMESDEQETIDSTKSSSIMEKSLGERLEHASELVRIHGRLPFDDDYIELVRALMFNPSLSHLEQLHLKSLFLDN